MNNRQDPADPDETDPRTIEEAADETPSAAAPEVTEETAELTSWDETPVESGTAAPTVLPEDETPAAELLVQEGLDEAERNLRMAAADPDFEP